MPESKKSSKKKRAATSEEKAPDTREAPASKLAPLPSLTGDLPTLDINPSNPVPAEDIQVPVDPIGAPSTPSSEELAKSLLQMKGPSPDGSAAVLAQEFLPLLAEKVDTLGVRLDGKLEEFSVTVTKQLTKDVSALRKDISSLSDALQSLHTLVAETIAPKLVALEGYAGAFSTKVTAQEVVEHQETSPEPTMPAPVEEISPKFRACIDAYLGMASLKGSQYPVATFLESILSTYENVASMASYASGPHDNVETGTAYLIAQGANVTNGTLVI